MSARESRPRQEGGPVNSTTPSVPLDYAHAGDMSGFDRGFAQGARFADEDRCHAILHDYAVRMAGIAVRTATANHGPGWGSEIAKQASGEDW